MAKKKAVKTNKSPVMEAGLLLLNSYTYELVQALIILELTSVLDSLEHDIKKRKEGGNQYGVFDSDKDEDIKIMKTHIDAIKLVLEYFGSSS